MSPNDLNESAICARSKRNDQHATRYLPSIRTSFAAWRSRDLTGGETDVVVRVEAEDDLGVNVARLETGADEVVHGAEDRGVDLRRGEYLGGRCQRPMH